MALTLNLAVLPVVASLVAGTGALATYATAPSAPSAPQTAVAPQTVVAPDAARPSPAPQAASACDAQTWPFIDGSCTKTSADARKVRVVTAPRASELPDATTRLHIPAPQNPNATPVALPPGLTTSDTVLRSPDIVVPPPPKVSKREKRAEQRRGRRFDAQSYQVPGDDRRPRAVIVVRPLRLEAYR